MAVAKVDLRLVSAVARPPTTVMIPSTRLLLGGGYPTTTTPDHHSWKDPTNLGMLRVCSSSVVSLAVYKDTCPYSYHRQQVASCTVRGQSRSRLPGTLASL